MDSIRWGILGTGMISTALAETIGALPDGKVVAVGSRQQSTADAFAARYGIEAAYGSYAALAAAPDVDVVYVGTTNDLHLPNTMACLAAGKPVLCEKPFALNRWEANRMVELARRQRLFLMEAMWMRFQPAFQRVQALVAEGRIGEVRLVQADFGFPADPNPEGRLFNPRLGGGSLLDVGIYPLNIAYSLLGAPASFQVEWEPAPTGVDAQLGLVVRHRNGGLSMLTSSLVADTGVEATVAGSRGRLRVHAPFHHSARVTLHSRDDLVETFEVGYQGWGYRFEVEEVHRCLREGSLESQRMPLADTLALMEWMDAIRDRLGLRYPGERA